MSAGRWTLVVVTTSIVAAVAGHFSAQPPTAPHHRPAPATADRGASPSREELLVAEGAGSWQAANEWLPEGEQETSPAEFAHAAAVVDAELRGNEGQRRAAAPPPQDVRPQQLTPPEDASPIDDAEADDGSPSASPADIKALIRQVLPEIGDDEAEILTEELRDRSLSEIHDFLHIRKQLRKELTRTMPGLPNLGDFGLPGESAESVPGDTFGGGSAGLVAAADPAFVAALRQCQRVARHNLANVSTVGHRRWMAITEEVVGPVGEPRGVTFRGIELDLSPGPTRPSANPMHVAIRGRGFFAVRADAEPAPILLTRRGDFEADEQSRLALRCGERLLPLWPRVRLPEGTEKVAIAGDGTVSVQTEDQSQTTPIGAVELFRPTTGGTVQPMGSGLLSLPAPAGERSLVPVTVALEPGALELSNVDAAAERARLEQIGVLLDQLTAGEER